MTFPDQRRSAADAPATGERGRPRRLATGRERTGAYLFDAVVVVGVLLALTRDQSPARRLRTLVVGAVGGATGYHVVLEGSRGQTVGKRLVGIAVVRADGTACGVRAAAVRTAARTVDWLPAGYCLGFASMTATERRQRVGDLAAGTVVVSVDEADGPQSGPDGRKQS